MSQELLAAQPMPKVSVVMPVFNAGPFLRSAVESVLRQTWSQWELLVVDDGSTDDCLDSIRDLDDPRIRVLRQDNRGKSAAMNRARAAATGEFWAILDADDVCHPRRLERQALCMLANADLGAVFCGHEVIVGGETMAPTWRSRSRDECAREIEQGAMPGHDPTAMYRTAAVADLDFAEELRLAQGMDFVLRVGERHPLLQLGECLYGYRVDSGSSKHRSPQLRNEMVREVYRRMCRRRGLSPAFADLITRPLFASPQVDRRLLAHFMISVADQVEAGRRLGALRAGLQFRRLHRRLPTACKPLLYAMMPRAMLRTWRRRRAEQQLQRWLELRAPYSLAG